MRIRRAALWLVSLIVPASMRPRWIAGWRAEVQHGGWRMLPGGLPDAWTLRRLAPKSPRHPLHAIDQDVRYAFRGLIAAPRIRGRCGDQPRRRDGGHHRGVQLRQHAGAPPARRDRELL